MLPHEIRAELIRSQISVSGIAKDLSVSQPSVSQVISGHRRNPRIRSAIAKALGLDVYDIWPDTKIEEQAA